MKFSCIYPLYYGSKLSEVKLSLKSILNQSLKANEILIIQDGPVKLEVLRFLKKLKKKKIKIVSFRNNLGLGKVLRKAVRLAKYDIIIRADADDFSQKERFKCLINYFKKNPEIHVVSSHVKEIYNKKILIKKLPLSHDEIVDIKNFKNPINHSAVAYKKKAVLKCGNYENLLYFEDYFLWLKMIEKKYKFHNLDKSLVISKINNDFYNRRSGLKYFRYYLKFLNKIKSKKYINIFEYLINFFLRGIIYILPKIFVINFYKFLNNRK